MNRKGKYKLLSFEKFDKYLQDIIACNKWVNSFCELVGSADTMLNKIGLSTSISLLEDTMGDDDDWIVYWLYDADYGMSWNEDTVTDENGNPICCRTSRELYDFLVTNCARKASETLDMFTEELQKSMKNYCEVGSQNSEKKPQ